MDNFGGYSTLHITFHDRVPMPYTLAYDPSYLDDKKVPSTINLDDDDPDVCILENMSQPPPKKRCHVDEKSNISGLWSTPCAPTSQDGFNHTRFEKKDEQSVYRAALQVSKMIFSVVMVFCMSF